MADINLLQNRIEESGINTSPVARAVAKILMLLVVLAIIGYGFLFFTDWRTKTKLAKVNEKIQAVQASAITNKDRLELITRQEQLIELETLIDNHTYWSYLLPELARVTIKTAKLTEINAKDNGKLSLTATLPTYEEIEKFLQIFDLPEYNQQFSNVKIESINRIISESSVATELRLQLIFNPEYIKGRM